jgi:LPS export ABC transporter protein LptC
MVKVRRWTRSRRLGLLLVGGAVVMTACEGDTNSPVANPELLSLDADQVAFGMTSFLSARGVREGRIQADTAYIYADSAMANLRQMEITFYDEAGRPRATVTGRSGQWRRDTDRMVARGDVVLVIHQDGSKIESQELFYDPDLDRVWSDSATVRTMPDGSVTSGSSFESDMSFENVRITGARGSVGRVF